MSLSTVWGATWSDAEARCESLGAQLAVVTDSGENAFVLGLLNGSAYLGATDVAVEDTWEWMDDTAWSYENWYVGQLDNYGANEDCAMMVDDGSAGDGFWYDVQCLAVIPFVCESAD
jgi:hypothetical protein